MQNTGMLQDKTFLLTGASRGIGAAIAEALGAAGAKVALVARDQTRLQQVADAVSNAGGQGHVEVVDLTEEAALCDLVGRLNKKWGCLDGLINNAGVADSSPIGQTASETWDRLMAVNARAAFILCRESLDLLRRADKPCIINISSVVGVKGYPNQVAYSASKHALRGMSIALANELKDEKINVHVICPGGVATDMATTMRPDINLDKMIQVEEIARLVIYLLTGSGNGVIDELHIRRQSSDPWFG